MTLSSSNGSAKAAENLLSQLYPRIDLIRDDTDRPIVIAIDGHSGAGKSTIAAQMAQALLAAIVCCDDFYAGGTEPVPLAANQLADICIDRPRLRKALEALKANRHALYAPFDWHAFDGSLAASKILTAARPIIISEGVYSAHPDLHDIIDIAVLVQTLPAERERRLLEREGTLGSWERQWHRAEDWYFETLMPPEVFDIVIYNA